MMYVRKTYRMLIIVGALVLIGVLLAWILLARLPGSMRSDAKIAADIVTACAKEKGSSRDLCYEKSVPALMDKGLSMERAYAVTAIVQELDPTYHYCHVLAHLISAKETAKDPSKWKDIIARVPAGMCGNGALHGAFQERFRSTSLPNASVEEVRNLIAGACDPREGWSPTLIERSSCMHGMGHLLVYITDANISKSIALCEVLGKGKAPVADFVETCEEGVFMQIYQPLEPEDIGLVAKLTSASKDRVKFCSQYPGLAFETCIKESWPVEKEHIMTPEGFDAVCAPLKGKDGYDNCVRGLVFVVMGMKEYDAKSMLSLCSQLPDPSVRDICVSRTAVRFVETDWKNVPQAIAVCSDSPPSADACWKELSGYAEQGMKPDSPQTKALCGGMPEKWRSTCLTNTHTTL
ncbi:hypothetical protein K8R03_02835 [Candidatus Kaiserbacteria bacterium]|nr:hypothetical protein [Candidatus Kaiserbacteria bacterium]